jgi:nondiscriminating glutamyl-tRNA synthetase
MFDLDRVSKSPAVFDIAKLNWFNGEYIRKLPLSLITERAKPYIAESDLHSYSSAQLEEMIATVREGLTMLSDVSDATRFYFGTIVDVPGDLQQSVLSTASARKVLDKTLQSLSSMPWGDHKGCKAIVDGIGKELSVKGKDLYWPLRAALSGKTQGPDLGSLISVLGESRVRARLEAALPLCSPV